MFFGREIFNFPSKYTLQILSLLFSFFPVIEFNDRFRVNNVELSGNNDYECQVKNGHLALPPKKKNI